MKTVPTYLLVPAAVVGFAIAWVVKPEAAPEVNETSVAAPEVAEVAPPPRASDREDSPRIRSDSPAVARHYEDLSPEQKQAMEDAQELMANQMRERNEKRIADLVTRLGLDAGQEARLREFFDKRTDFMTRMSEPGDTTDVMSLMEEVSAESMDQLMEELLSESQAQAYEEFRTEERSRKVESAALMRLASLGQQVRIRPEQRDAVYDIIFEESGEMVDRQESSGEGAMYEMFDTGYGANLALVTDDLYSFEDAGELMELGADGEYDEAAIRSKMKEAMLAKIEAKVDRFEGVLDAEQLEEYRDSLEAKASTMFGAMELIE